MKSKTFVCAVKILAVGTATAQVLFLPWFVVAVNFIEWKGIKMNKKHVVILGAGYAGLKHYANYKRRQRRRNYFSGS